MLFLYSIRRCLTYSIVITALLAMTMFTSATPIPAEASESGHSLPTPSRPKWIAQMDYDPPEPSEDFRKILPKNYPTHKTREIHVIRDLDVRERLGEKFHTAFLKVYEKLALKVNGDMILHTYFDPSAGPPVVFTASGDSITFFMDCEARIYDQVAQTTGPSMYILRMSLVIHESGNGGVSAVSYYELAPIPGEVVRGRYK
ncbi:hypothetical protein F5878DRAFT_332490 [Lentinula raphanica]|uniref:Uncharacterized protein n=1 Tax=Lentinula raphanica TaxID=153919 RepID=A0AA38P2B2_9AGAR|nr:hypothetical protein F5878DRAFT_332490 [Lentinula raphanica]